MASGMSDQAVNSEEPGRVPEDRILHIRNNEMEDDHQGDSDTDLDEEESDFRHGTIHVWDEDSDEASCWMVAYSSYRLCYSRVLEQGACGNELILLESTPWCFVGYASILLPRWYNSWYDCTCISFTFGSLWRWAMGLARSVCGRKHH